MNTPFSRRRFLRRSALAGTGLIILEDSRSVWSAQANEKINLAVIGVTGRGGWFVQAMPGLGTNFVALCDVNDYRAADTYKRFPQARTFTDFRRMFDAMEKEIDAVTVATPDHTHAVASMAAIRHGKAVLCEKPLTHDVREARALREAAAKHQVVTQLGNQGTASEAFRRSLELIDAGVLGEIREVLAWKDSGGAGPRERPQGTPPVPDDLRWDLWLGPAADRPYHPSWMKWHSWRDFATGELGNWASHTLNLAFRALKLHTLWPWHRTTQAGDSTPARLSVQARCAARHGLSFPRWEIVEWTIPARGALPPVRITWHNGASAPGSRALIEEQLGRQLDWGDAGAKRWDDHAGCLIIGSKARLHLNAHNTVFTLLPEARFKDFAGPPKTVPRSPGHEREFLDACRGGPPAMSNFDLAAPLAEFLLLGNVATLFEDELQFDPEACRILNNREADTALLREYRKGWAL